MQAAEVGRLLIVEDDRLVRVTLAQELRALGYAVIEAASGDEALARCEVGHFDLALVDVRMPGMSGIALTDTLRWRWGLRSVILSAFSDPHTVEEASRNGALGYLVKPLRAAQLMPEIETAIARAGEEREMREREEQLSTALSANRETSIAVGIVMAREAVDRVQAFELLRRRARSQRRKLAEVAAEVVHAGERLSDGTGRNADGTDGAGGAHED